MNQNKFIQTEIGEIPGGWDTTLLSKVAIVNEKSINRDYKHENIEYIDVSSTLNGELLETQKLSLKDAPSRAKRIVSDDDILISTVRPNLKHFAFISKAKSNLVASTGYAVISSKKINSRFLYYYLTTEEYTNYLSAIADTTTSTYPAFNPDVLEKSLIPFPPANEQQQIASILSSLDDKIELNRGMNKTLEEIGKALFKRWFVDFEFPNENGEPYKSSGGEMVESELGMIPKGWEVRKLPEVSEIKKGLSYKGKDLSEISNTALVGLKCIERGGGFRNDGFKPYDGVYKEEHVLKPGDLIVAMTDLTQAADVIGKPAIVPIIPQIETLVASLDLSIIKPTQENIDEYYLYLLLSRQESQDFLYGYTNGSTVLHLSIKGLKEFKLLLPEESIVVEFQKILQPIRKKLDLLDAEISYLPLLRDSLLPRLMSGRIRVN